MRSKLGKTSREAMKRARAFRRGASRGAEPIEEKEGKEKEISLKNHLTFCVRLR